MHSSALIPRLRFTSFLSDWDEFRFAEVFERVVTKNQENNQNVITISAQHGLINQQKYFNKSVSAKDVTGYYLLEKGNFAYNKSYSKDYPVGAIKRLNNYDKGVVSTLYICFKTTGKQHDEFWEQYFEAGMLNREINKIAQEGARNHGLLNISVVEFFKDIKVKRPKIKEQQKIANFLSAVDKKISLLKEKHALLEQYKKGVMQKLFSQEIRFKDENGKGFPDWEDSKFDNLFERVTQKNKENNLNVLTISAKRGLINQQKYFNKSVSAKNVTGYYLLNNGDFAYNKSYSKGYPMGAIKRLNNYDKGVVSTLYICFKSHGDQHDAFWEQYFEAGLLNREISKIAQEGARNHGLLNVSVTEFFRDIAVRVPSKNEQIKIAEFLRTLDKKLGLVSQQMEHTKTFKKGLLQQMFV